MENITHTIPEIPIIVEKPKTNYLNLILISLGFVLFLASAYFLGRQSAELPSTSIVPTKNPVAVLPKTTNIDTMKNNYKGHYFNTQFGFSFDYPQNYLLDENSPIQDGKSYYVSVISPIDQTNRKGYELQNGELKVEVWIAQNFKNQNLKEYFDEQVKMVNDDPVGIGGKVISTKDLTIGGVPAKSMTWQGNGSGVTYYLMNKNSIITIAQYPAITSLQSDFDKILASFELIESKAENIKGWVKKDNSTYFTNDDCIYMTIGKPQTTSSTLEQYLKKQFNLFEEVPINETQYVVKDFQSLTLPPMNMGEIANVFTIKNKTINSYTIYNNKQAGPPICKTDYRSEITTLFNSITL